MIKKLVALLVLFALMFNSFGTEQTPDTLIINGERYWIGNVNPMELFFEKFPRKRPRTVFCDSALNRGYFATFEIIQNGLWVVDIETRCLVQRSGCTGSKSVVERASVMKDIFGGQERVKMDWFSGLLIMPQGGRVRYEPTVSTYERHKILEIRNGNVIRELNMNFEEYMEFQAKQFELYKKTDAYKERLAIYMNHRDIGNNAEREIRRLRMIYLDTILEE